VHGLVDADGIGEKSEDPVLEQTIRGNGLLSFNSFSSRGEPIVREWSEVDGTVFQSNWVAMEVDKDGR
jgi:hypothetical protein